MDSGRSTYASKVVGSLVRSFLGGISGLGGEFLAFIIHRMGMVT